MKLDPKLSKKVARNVDADLVIECTWDGKPAVVAFGKGMVAVVGAGLGTEILAPHANARVVASSWLLRRLRCYGMEVELIFEHESPARQFDDAMTERRPAGSGSLELQPVPVDRVTTLPALPGHRILRTFGVVTELSSASGLWVTGKANSALQTGMVELRARAAAMGANAVVGLTSSAFSATGAFTIGGDSVGVLLVGTAILVAPVEGPDED